jgi:hypothetical protein
LEIRTASAATGGTPAAARSGVDAILASLHAGRMKARMVVATAERVVDLDCRYARM